MFQSSTEVDCVDKALLEVAVVAVNNTGAPSPALKAAARLAALDIWLLD